jgi:hypothetical protein
MTFEEFKNRLDKATKEEVVKTTYASYFKLKYDTSHHHHLYIPQEYFEFKAYTGWFCSGNGDKNIGFNGFLAGSCDDIGYFSSISISCRWLS